MCNAAGNAWGAFGTLGSSFSFPILAPGGNIVYGFSSDADTGIGNASTADTLNFRTGGTNRLLLDNSRAKFGVGTSIQVFNLDTDVSNFERANIRFTGNTLYLETENAGTGVGRPISIGTNGIGAITFFTNSTNRWSIATGTGHLSAFGAYNITTTGDITARHYISTGNNPTCAVNSGAGTGASCSFSVPSTDSSGMLTVTTGTGTTSPANLVTVTFTADWGAVPKCHIDPADTAAAALSNSQAFVEYTGVSATAYSIFSAATPPASTILRFWYNCER
jgi:hypothetical protein